MLFNIFIGITLIIVLLIIWFALGRLFQERFALLRTNYLITIPLGFSFYFAVMWIVSLPFVFLGIDALSLFITLILFNGLLVFFVILNYKYWFHKYIKFKVLLFALIVASWLIITYYILWPTQNNYQTEDFITIINRNADSNNLWITFNSSVFEKFNTYYLWIAFVVRIFGMNIAFLTNWILTILMLIVFSFFVLGSISITFKSKITTNLITVFAIFILWHFVLNIFPWTGIFICFCMFMLIIALYIRYLNSSYRNRYYLIIASIMSVTAFNFSWKVSYLNLIIFYIVFALIVFKYRKNFTIDFILTFFLPCFSLAFIAFNFSTLFGWVVLIFYFWIMFYTIFHFYKNSSFFLKIEKWVYEDRILVFTLLPIFFAISSSYLLIIERSHYRDYLNVDYFFHFHSHILNMMIFVVTWGIEIGITVYIIYKYVHKNWIWDKTNILIMWIWISILLIVNPLFEILTKKYLMPNYNYQIIIWIAIIPLLLLIIKWLSLIKKFNWGFSTLATAIVFSTTIALNVPNLHYSNYDPYTLVNKGAHDISDQMDEYIIDHKLGSINYMGDYEWINVYFKNGNLINNSDSQFINNIAINKLNVNDFKNAIDRSVRLIKDHLNWVVKLRTNIDSSIKINYNVILYNDFYYVFKVD